MDRLADSAASGKNHRLARRFDTTLISIAIDSPPARFRKMFDFPKQAELNRLLSRNKVYEFARPSRAVRDRFVRQIGEIVWKYKLAPETINLPARQGIEEIQVFAIALKTRELTAAALRPVLLTIDKAIPSPVFLPAHFRGARQVHLSTNTQRSWKLCCFVGRVGRGRQSAMSTERRSRPHPALLAEVNPCGANVLRPEHLLLPRIPGVDLLDGCIRTGCRHFVVRPATMRHPVDSRQ